MGQYSEELQEANNERDRLERSILRHVRNDQQRENFEKLFECQEEIVVLERLVSFCNGYRFALQIFESSDKSEEDTDRFPPSF